MHGWIPEHHDLHLALVATHKKSGVTEMQDYVAQIEAEKETTPQWVSRKDQEVFLRSQGYRHVQAVGLPFAYLPPSQCTRVPGSLLVMPPHTHEAHGPGDPLAEAYADAIAEKRKEFSEIWVCLNSHDYTHGEWVEPFRKRNIPIFVGADQSDKNTLHRLKHLLSSFEYVTTNGFGSHIAYAAAAGAKLSIFGPFAEHPREAMSRAWAVRVYPELIDVLCALHSEETAKKYYSFLIGDPEKAECHIEWGRRQIGGDLMLEPDEMIDLFGWRETEIISQGGARANLALASG